MRGFVTSANRRGSHQPLPTKLQIRRELRGCAGSGRNHHLFSVLKAKPFQSAYVRALLHRLTRRARIAKRVPAHGRRHTLAFELANEGRPLHLIQAQLGQSSLAIRPVLQAVFHAGGDASM